MKGNYGGEVFGSAMGEAELTAAQKAELAELAALPDDSIDPSDIPALPDDSGETRPATHSTVR